MYILARVYLLVGCFCNALVSTRSCVFGAAVDAVSSAYFLAQSATANSLTVTIMFTDLGRGGYYEVCRVTELGCCLLLTTYSLLVLLLGVQGHRERMRLEESLVTAILNAREMALKEGAPMG